MIPNPNAPSRCSALGLACAAALGLVTSLQATTIGYYTDDFFLSNTGTTSPAAAITAAGHTPLQITDITTFDLDSVPVLMINESDNLSMSFELFFTLPAIETWVNGGGRLIFHDGLVADGEGFFTFSYFLFGPAGQAVQVARDFVNPAAIDLTAAGAAAFPALNNGSLDGGNSSSHGFADAATLPGDAVSYLFRDGEPNNIVSFSYPLGDGQIYYSTIPLAFYLDGGLMTPPATLAAFKDIYAPAAVTLSAGPGVVSNPPVAVCADVVVVAGEDCQAAASVDNGSYDPDDDPITLSQTPAGPYPLGATTVTLTVTDTNSGLTATCTATVTVVDNTPPTIACPADIVVGNDAGLCSAMVSFAATATDNCSVASVTYSHAPGSAFPKGVTTVTATATDGSGNQSACTFTVTVNDTEAPVASGVNTSGNNYLLNADDNCDAPTALTIYVGDSDSAFVAGPFAAGTAVKIIKAPKKAGPSYTPPQGGGPGTIKLKGTPLFYAIDTAGNQSVPTP